MTIYILEATRDYEGSIIAGAFLSLDAAKLAADKGGKPEAYDYDLGHRITEIVADVPGAVAFHRRHTVTDDNNEATGWEEWETRRALAAGGAG